MKKTAIGLNKCLEEIKLPSTLYRWAPIFELPFNINTTNKVKI